MSGIQWCVTSAQTLRARSGFVVTKVGCPCGAISLSRGRVSARRGLSDPRQRCGRKDPSTKLENPTLSLDGCASSGLECSVALTLTDQNQGQIGI